MKKLLIIIIFSAIVSATKAESIMFEMLLGDIEQAIEHENWQKADSLTTIALRCDPGNPINPLLLSNQGMLRYYQGLDSIALETLNDACRMAPGSTKLLQNRATVEYSMNRIDDALSDYEKIVAIDSLYYDAHIMIGMISLNNADLPKAFLHLKKAESIKPDIETTLAAFLAYYTAINDYNDALPYCDLLIKTTPSADYYAGRAMCYLYADRLQDAAEDIATGLELDPNNPELYLTRALLNKLRYDPDSAKKDATRAIELGGDPRRVSALMD